MGKLCPTDLLKVNHTPAFILNSYQKTFEDNFIGQTQLDLSKWDTSYYWGPGVTINNEEQYYVDIKDPTTPQPTNPFSFGPNGLIITAAPWQPNINGRHYTSGLINTKNTKTFTEAYVEYRMKPPCNADGSWPAGWLLNHRYYDNSAARMADEGGVNDKFNPEIDWPEFVTGGNNNGTQFAKAAYHYFTGDKNDPNNYSRWTLDANNFIEVAAHPNNAGTLLSQFNVYQDCAGQNQFTLPESTGVDFCQDFHTFGIHRVPNDFIHFYLDGVLVGCINGANNIIAEQRMYVLFNLAVGGNYPFGNPPTQIANVNDYPAQLEIQCVRIFEP